MKLTIFAATGGVGGQLLTQALDAGHEVTAVVRNPSKISRKEVRVVTADLAAPDRGALESAVDGADAVLSGLGPRSSSEAGIAWRGTQAIVNAMQATSARRLVVISAAPVGTVPSPARPNPPKFDPGDGAFLRHVVYPILKTLLRKYYVDLAQMEDIVRESSLDWTVVRPPQLTDKPLTGSYRVAFEQNLPRGLHISRADVAHFMLRALERADTSRRVVAIAD
ncbi:NAD(P)H-binding protein [Pendulispora brunnea]|uniref:NAD(P)H-binding protein n=1 Tax=Pendulispora brunnea TaxID=2905690 RepID=A0ABZ2K718_9BACT